MNTSVPTTQPDSQPLDASSTIVSTADSNSASTSAPCERPTLNLSNSVITARSETLESPAYVPINFSMLPHDAVEAQVAEVISSDKQQLVSDAKLENITPQTLGSVHQSHGVVASISIETETASGPSASSYEKLMPAAQSSSAVKTSKFAASVRRKFTVSKTVLPSSAAPPVVVYSKLASEEVDHHEDRHVDDVGRVHIVNKAVSTDVNAADKPPVVDVVLPPSAATQPVPAVPTASSDSLESSVITSPAEPVSCADQVTAGSQFQQEISGLSLQLALIGITEIENDVYKENADDDEVFDSYCDKGTDEKVVQACSSLYAQQSMVDTTPVSCTASEHTAAETSTVSDQFNDSVCPPDKDNTNVNLREIDSAVDGCGMVQASSQESCPSAVTDCTASECDSETRLNSLQCTTDELPSDTVLAAQDSCFIVARTTTDVPLEASLSLPSSSDDTPSQHSLDCGNASLISESMPATTQYTCVQDQAGD